MHVASRGAGAKAETATPVTYMIFDLLWLDGHSLMALPYASRRERLQGLDARRASTWQTPEYVARRGRG